MRELERSHGSSAKDSGTRKLDCDMVTPVKNAGTNDP